MRGGSPAAAGRFAGESTHGGFMRVEKRVLNDALRVLGKVVCQTSPVELYRSVRFVGMV